MFSGVRRGSALDHLLFNILISDWYVKICLYNLLIVANDQKMYRAVKPRDECRCLQTDINAIRLWRFRSYIDLSIQKTEVVFLYRYTNGVSFS
jgi:hypothetical protein